MQLLGLAGASGGGENKTDDAFQKTEGQGKGFDLMGVLSGQQSPTGGSAWASPKSAETDPTKSKLNINELLGWLK